MALRKIRCSIGSVAAGKDFSSFNSWCYVVEELEKSFSVNLGENGRISALIRNILL